MATGMEEIVRLRKSTRTVMKVTCNNQTIEIPDSFLWVIQYMNQWCLENKTGDMRLIYKDGGICGIENKEFLRPNKKSA